MQSDSERERILGRPTDPTIIAAAARDRSDLSASATGPNIAFESSSQVVAVAVAAAAAARLQL
jgi:hypothetical protein